MHLSETKIVHEEKEACTRKEILSRLRLSYMAMATNADKRKLRYTLTSMEPQHCLINGPTWSVLTLTIRELPEDVDDVTIVESKLIWLLRDIFVDRLHLRTVYKQTNKWR